MSSFEFPPGSASKMLFVLICSILAFSGVILGLSAWLCSSSGGYGFCTQYINDYISQPPGNGNNNAWAAAGVGITTGSIGLIVCGAAIIWFFWKEKFQQKSLKRVFVGLFCVVMIFSFISGTIYVVVARQVEGFNEIPWFFEMWQGTVTLLQYQWISISKSSFF